MSWVLFIYPFIVSAPIFNLCRFAPICGKNRSASVSDQSEQRIDRGLREEWESATRQGSMIVFMRWIITLALHGVRWLGMRGRNAFLFFPTKFRISGSARLIKPPVVVLVGCRHRYCRHNKRAANSEDTVIPYRYRRLRVAPARRPVITGGHTGRLYWPAPLRTGKQGHKRVMHTQCSSAHPKPENP